MDSNKDSINNYLKLAGLRCNYYRVRDFARKCEKLFSDNSVPEQHRIEAGCSMVWADERGAYQFTIKRTVGGYWALISAKGETFKQQESFFSLSPADYKENVTGAIIKTAAETSNNNLLQGSGSF